MVFFSQTRVCGRAEKNLGEIGCGAYLLMSSSS